MQFYITLKRGYRNYKILVQLKFKDERIEQYAVIGKNKEILIESNRPFFRNKGLKHRKPDWKVVSGKVDYGGALEDLFKAIMDVIDK